MTDFSLRFPADVSRIDLPGDFDQSVTRVHKQLDGNKDGFLDCTELGRLGLHSFSGTDAKVAYLLGTASGRLSEASIERNWIGLAKSGVSLLDLKSVKQLDANKQLVEQGLLADLEFVFGDRDIHRPVTTARFLREELPKIDTSGDGHITRYEVESAMRSQSAETAAIGKMLHDHFTEISSLDGGDNWISNSALRQFQYLLDPRGGLVQRHEEKRGYEKVKAVLLGGGGVAALVGSGVIMGGLGSVPSALCCFAAAGATAFLAYDQYRGGLGPRGSYVAGEKGDIDSLYFAGNHDRELYNSSGVILSNHAEKSAVVRGWSHFRK